MKKLNKIVLGAILLLCLTVSGIYACSRVVYHGTNGVILTARSMDWVVDVKTDLWIFPRGMERNGAAGPRSVTWKSKYGSVVASAFGCASSDGLNEKGLAANVLWLSEAEYPQPQADKPNLCLSAWLQYVLDNYATVDEAVKDLEQEKFVVVTAQTPGQKGMATLHLSLSDPSGDNAIFEYLGGKLVIHHSPEYQVMTNSPTFDQQLALDEYWKEIGGNVMLPGTSRAADRFVRASFYIHAIPQTDNLDKALAGIFSVIRNCSAPYGLSTPDKPNISSTRWRTVADHKNKVYYFDSATSPNVFWVDFKNVDFSPQAGVRKLNLTGGEIYSGDAAKQFKPAEPFKFLGS